MELKKFAWWKLIVGYLFYLLFHEITRFVPGVLGMIFGEGISGVYPHMKMLFYAYIPVASMDYFLRRPNVNLAQFIYARMLILAAVPWMMIVIYFTFEAMGIALPGRLELVWGLASTALGLYYCIRLEEPFEAMPLRGAVKGLIILAFATAFITYTGFSFTVPDNFFSVNR